MVEGRHEVVFHASAAAGRWQNHYLRKMERGMTARQAAEELLIENPGAVLDYLENAPTIIQALAYARRP